MHGNHAAPAGTLGICATTRSGARHVFGLVDAAVRAEIAAEVFLTGEGVCLVRDDRFDTLVASARVSICDASYRAAGLGGEPVAGLTDKDYVTQWRNAEMVERCDRYLVL